MSYFAPTKLHLREVLVFCFHMKKSAAESRRLIMTAYGEYAPSISTCEYWFRRFKNGDFIVNDRERPGQPKKFEDKALQLALNEDPCLTLQQLANLLEVDASTVGKRLKAMGIIQKQGNWVPHELKPPT